MRRRTFIARLATALAAGLVPRFARGQGAPADSVSAAPPDTSAARKTTAPPDTTTAPDTTATAPGGPLFTLAAAGDTTLGYNLEAHVDEQLAAGVPREQLWPLYFAGVRPVLESADLAIVNLECPFTERGRKLVKNFNFRARRELVEILKAGGVGAVTLANNHMMDYGREGVDDTIATLDAAGIAHFGAGRNLGAARKPLVVERGGLRLGLLGYYFQDERDMLEPEAVFATKHRAGVAGCYRRLDCIRRQIEEDVPRLVERVDAAIAFFHWGKEGSYEVRDYQIELAHRCVELGCRAVLGAHPHRLQGIEVVRGAPIVYSLGNFVFGGNKDPQDKLSMIVKLRVGPAGVLATEVVPIQVTRWPEAPFQPFALEGAARTAALARIAELSAGFPETLPQLRG